jgi:hypothetical protein
MSEFHRRTTQRDLGGVPERHPCAWREKPALTSACCIALTQASLRDVKNQASSLSVSVALLPFCWLLAIKEIARKFMTRRNNDLFTKQDLNACCGCTGFSTSANACKLAVSNLSCELYRIVNHLNIVLVCLWVVSESNCAVLLNARAHSQSSTQLKHVPRVEFCTACAFILLSGKNVKTSSSS